MIMAIPEGVPKLNPNVTIIGFACLGLLIIFPFLKNAISQLKPIPAQVVVLLVAVPLAYLLKLPDGLKVNVPQIIPGVFSNYEIAFKLPD